MKYTIQQLMEKHDNLPADVKSSIFSADVEKALTAIGEKYSLHIDQIGELMEEVDLVMLGITHSKDFIRNLYERLDVGDKEKVRQIAHEVNEQVFAKIRESLKQIHHVENETRNTQLETNLAVPPPSATETKDELIEKIEHPEKDIIKDKLEKMNSMPKEESEYEIKTKNDQNKKKESLDPYREPLT